MPITKDLLLAILSMDSYNRGYGAGISGLSDAVDTQVGTAKVSKRLQNVSDTFEPEAKAAGFYAISYKLDAAVGEGADRLAKDTTIISYRGTDNADLLGTADGASDVWNGWVGAAGVPTGPAGLAFDFFEAVSGADAFDGVDQGTVLTGHSLGGGLAGLVGNSDLI